MATENAKAIFDRLASPFARCFNSRFAGWGQGEKILFLMLALNLAYSIWVCLVYFLNNFARSYQGGELLISWQGGLLRRGLIGSVLSLLADWPYMPEATVLFMSAAYAACLIGGGKILFALAERPWAILLLGAPAMLPFFCYKTGVLKKDIFFIAAVCGMMAVAAARRKKGWGMGRACALMSLLFALSLLIHELTLMFLGFPLALALVASPTAREKWRALAFFAILAAAGALFVFVFSGTPEQREIIIEFWRARFPDLNASAIEAIGYGLTDREAHHYIFPYLANPSLRASVAKAAILAALPLAGFWRSHAVNRRAASLAGAKAALFFWAQAIVALLAVALIMNDAGRIISFFSIFIAAFGLAVIWLSDSDPSLIKGPSLNLDNRAVFVLACAYLFCWKVESWVPLSSKTWLSLQYWQSTLLGG